MLKNFSRIELKIENKMYQLIFDTDAQLGSVKEAVFQLQKYLGRIEDAIIAQEEEKKKQEENKVEEPKVEEINIA
jgi:uncharacterized membrane protein